jgi:signal transduction histidine kinase/ligand-binding sensor domain-containing protein
VICSAGRELFTAMRSLCLVVLFSLISMSRSQALDPSLHISEYGHTAWRLQDGFFTGAPTAIAQTADGYLWIGTADGLFRFDGVRFVPWTEITSQEQLASAEISALLGARDGSLWIGAGYRFYRWKDETLTQYSTSKDQFVDSIVETGRNGIWLTRERYEDQDGPLCQVQGSGLHCYGQGDGVHLVNAFSLAEDATGDFWMGGSAQLVRWAPGRSTVWKLKTLRQSEGLNGVEALAVGRNDSLWVGLNYQGPGLGLEQFRDGAWKTFSSPQLNGSELAVSRLFLDRDGALWVGTEGQGIYRIVHGTADHFDSADGLSGDKITAIFQDHEGTLWVATSKGIDSFRNLPVVTLSRRQGLHLDDAHSILSSKDGNIWIGNDGALDAWRNEAITSILSKDGLPGRQVTSMLQDPTGGLWIGIDNGLFHFEHRKFVPVIQPGGPNLVITMTAGPDGSLWAGLTGATVETLTHLENGHLFVRQKFVPGDALLALATDPRGRIWLAGDKLRYLDHSGETSVSELGPQYGYIRNIAVDGADFVWFGATRGLIAFRDGKMQVMTATNGLPCERINTLILDNHHSLWLYAQCGLIRIDRNELEKWWRHPGVRVKTTLFDAMDGFQGGPSSFRPAATKSPDGRLWFVNDGVVQMVNPDRLYANDVPPPVRVEQVVAGGKAWDPAGAVRLPKLSHNIEIKYTALSFVVPQRVRFRYELQGYDIGWQNAGTRRSAFYTNLRPGTYTFRVTACNNSGVWNSHGAALTFVILPTWYQSTWFRLLALLSLILLSYAFYLVRMRQYATAIRVRFDERLDERTRIARELHDTLLQSFHGLMFRFQAARNLMPQKPDSAMQVLDEAIHATEQALAEGRETIRDLRPQTAAQRDLAEMLTAAGSEISDAAAASGPIPGFRVIVEGQPQRLSPTLQREVYLIGREVIRNAFYHAGATRIEAEVLYDERQLRMRIRDDGKGIAPKDLEENGRPGHWGLAGIRERAQRIGAQLEFWSETGAGTEVELRVPAAITHEKRRDGKQFRLFRHGGTSDRRS